MKRGAERVGALFFACRGVGWKVVKCRLAAIPVAVVVVAIAEVCAAITFQVVVSFIAFVSPVTRLAAVRPEVLDGFVVAPFCVGDAAIAVIPAIGFRGGRAGENENTTECQSSESGFAEERREPQNRKFHESLQERARAGFGMTS